MLADKGKQNPTITDSLILIFAYELVSIMEQDDRLKQKYPP